MQRLQPWLVLRRVAGEEHRRNRIAGLDRRKRVRVGYGPECLRGSERILASRFRKKRGPKRLGPGFCDSASTRLATAHEANEKLSTGKTGGIIQRRVTHRGTRSCAWLAPRARRRG